MKRKYLFKGIEELLRYPGLEGPKYCRKEVYCSDPNSLTLFLFEALMNIIKETGLAALIATHNMELAKAMDKQVGLQEGRLIELGISSIIGNNSFY